MDKKLTKSTKNWSLKNKQTHIAKLSTVQTVTDDTVTQTYLKTGQPQGYGVGTHYLKLF